jgi:hypothetical protein
MYIRFIRILGAIMLTVTTAAGAHAQHAGHDHAQRTGEAQDTEMGHAAFAALAEVTRILMSNPNTDWSHVSLERPRQNLIDMNEVALNAQVASTKGLIGLMVLGSHHGPHHLAITRGDAVHGHQ